MNTETKIMNTETKRKLHPVLLVSSIAALVFSVAGTAAIMGWIPDSRGNTSDAAELKPAAQPLQNKQTTAVKKAQHVPHAAKRQEPAKHASNHQAAACDNCGVVESVNAVLARGEGSGVGAVGGAVVGGLLGNQVGGGNGKKAMTVVGAVGGALAGHQIEKHVRATTSYETVVRMNNGSSRSISATAQPTWRNGDRVKIVDGVIRYS